MINLNTPPVNESSRPVELTKSEEATARIFNTAMISTEAHQNQNLSEELVELTRTAPFQTLMRATQQLSSEQGIPEKEAAESLIETFRKLDRVWSHYVYLTGVDKIKGQS